MYIGRACTRHCVLLLLCVINTPHMHTLVVVIDYAVVVDSMRFRLTKIPHILATRVIRDGYAWKCRRI